MKPFDYQVAESGADAVRRVAGRAGASFFAGGTTLVDLMRIDVLAPDALVDVSRLPLRDIEASGDRLTVGANVSNSDLAWHPVVRAQLPALTQAILSGATTQIRNMASVAGNLLQRTRCVYFRDVDARCNKRVPGAGCDAREGFNRGHAVLGTSDHCIATHPSDMCVALVLFDTEVHTLRPDGTTRRIPFGELHVLPGETPHLETVLEPGELVTHVQIPLAPMGRRSRYLKVRDRSSYEFAVASAAVALDLEGDTIREARLALGGVATRPWRCRDAEAALTGRAATPETFRQAADVALADAVAQRDNAFKIELARRTIVRAFSTLAEVTA